jgi:hypothetical protein
MWYAFGFAVLWGPLLLLVLAAPFDPYARSMATSTFFYAFFPGGALSLILLVVLLIHRGRWNSRRSSGA